MRSNNVETLEIHSDYLLIMNEKLNNETLPTHPILVKLCHDKDSLPLKLS